MFKCGKCGKVKKGVEMMGKLIFIGLGLYDERDITLKGLERVKDCDVCFAEFYTAVLTGTNIERIESVTGKEIRVLSREDVEDGNAILNEAVDKNVAFLVPGDPMTATTHLDLRLRALDLRIETEIVHGSSVITAVASLLGLQHYKFGRITTIPFIQDGFFPESPYDVIKSNKENGLHTLVLLDIEGDARCMKANEGMQYLLALEEKREEGVITTGTLICVVARAGSSRPKIRAGYIKDLMNENFGEPMHTLVLPASLHFMEADALVKLAGAPEEIKD